MGIHDYIPFGPEASGGQQEPSLSLLKYTGHERDLLGSEQWDTLDYMHARYYSPMLGRFFSIDPVLDLKSAMRSPQGWNRYAYVRNNPMRFVDPTGRYICNGSKDDCAAVEAALTKVRTAAGNLEAGSFGRARLDAVLKFYGDAGKKNGVIVSPTTLSATRLGETERMRFKTITVRLDMQNIEKAFGSRTDGVSAAVETAAVMAHEGQHGIFTKAGQPYNTFRRRQQTNFTTVEIGAVECCSSIRHEKRLV